MKFIKGNYNRVLKPHEEIRKLTRREKTNKFYYLQENGDFSCRLMIYDETINEENFESDTDFKEKQNIFVCNIDLGCVNFYTAKDLKNIIKEKGLD